MPQPQNKLISGKLAKPWMIYYQGFQKPWLKNHQAASPDDRKIQTYIKIPQNIYVLPRINLVPNTVFSKTNANLLTNPQAYAATL